MTLTAPRSGWLRIVHPTLLPDVETYAPIVGFENAWYDEGWRSPLDDPAFSTLDVIDGGGAAAVSDVVDAGGVTPATDLITGGPA